MGSDCLAAANSHCQRPSRTIQGDAFSTAKLPIGVVRLGAIQRHSRTPFGHFSTVAVTMSCTPPRILALTVHRGAVCNLWLLFRHYQSRVLPPHRQCLHRHHRELSGVRGRLPLPASRRDLVRVHRRQNESKESAGAQHAFDGFPHPRHGLLAHIRIGRVVCDGAAGGRQASTGPQRGRAADVVCGFPRGAAQKTGMGLVRQRKCECVMLFPVLSLSTTF